MICTVEDKNHHLICGSEEYSERHRPGCPRLALFLPGNMAVEGSGREILYQAGVPSPG